LSIRHFSVRLLSLISAPLVNILTIINIHNTFTKQFLILLQTRISFKGRHILSTASLCGKYNTHLSVQLSVATLKPCQMELHPLHGISLSICHPDVYVQADYVCFIPYISETAVNIGEMATKGTDRKYSTERKHM